MNKVKIGLTLFLLFVVIEGLKLNGGWRREVVIKEQRKEGEERVTAKERK